MSARIAEPLRFDPGRMWPAVEGAAQVATPSDQRTLTLWADDRAAAQVWRQALVPEGLHIDMVDTVRVAGDGHVLFVNAGLSTQLASLRGQRLILPTVPLLVVCRSLRDLDQVLALEMGADDVVDTQLSAPVVAARLRALWRRQVPGAATAARQELRFGALCLKASERRVWLDDTQVPLSEGEFEVLWLLASHAGRAVARSEILLRVRGLHDQPLDRSIDSRVYRIRAKLGDAGQANPRIRTVRNFGYAFSPREW